MKPFAFPLLTDENIGPGVVAGLEERGCDVRTVVDEGLTGSSDKDVLTRAVQHGRVVVTHDLDLMYKVADRVVLLHEGRMIFFGSVADLEQCDHPHAREFLAMDQIRI